MSFHQGNPSAMEVPHQTHEWRNYVRTVPLPQGRPNATACASTFATPAAQTTVSPLVSDTTEINSENNNVDFAYFDALPAGYRFCPHDEELIVHYLMKKVHGQQLPRNKIMEVNLYKHNPEELAEKFRRCGEKEWYFFTPRNKKYRNGSRPNRAAGDGYWKATGADKDVKYNGVKVGCRKALVFYLGRPPKGDKTNWIMHEFRVKDAPPLSPRDDRDDMMLDEWVLCKIYKKALKPNLRNQAADEVERAADELEQEQPDITDVADDQVVTDADDHQNMDADFNTGDCPSLDQYFSFYQPDTLSSLPMDHHQKPPLPDSSASFSNHAQYENFYYCNEISPFDSGFTEADWTVMENQNDGPWMESVQNNILSPNNPLN